MRPPPAFSGVVVYGMELLQIADFSAPLIKLVHNVFQRDAAVYHQHRQVIEKVGKLHDRFVIVVPLGGDDHLGAFLAAFFQDFIHPFGKEVTGIGAFLRVLPPVAHHLI